MAVAHDHDHGSECKISGRYSDYIKAHLNAMKDKCDKLISCVNKLIEQQNPLSVLKGEGFKLKKLCPLVQKDRDGNFTSEFDDCTTIERNNIRRDIETHLVRQLLDKDTKKWKSVDTCLDNHFGDTQKTTRVDEICIVAGKARYMCNERTHAVAEKFFNDEIYHLRCSCQELANHSHLPLAAIIGISAGGFLLFLALVLTCFCLWRRRRRQKKKKKSPQVVYVRGPSNGDSAIYQDIYDDRGPMASNPNPPNLPMRYSPHPPANRQDEEPAYLDPSEVGGSRYRPSLPAPRQVSNSGYELPPKYSEKAEDDKAMLGRGHTLNNDDLDANYFQPLPAPPSMPLPNPPPDDAAYEMAKDIDLGDEYDKAHHIEQAPPPTSAENTLTKKLGPVPAKRTKKDARALVTESDYFELEKVRDEVKTLSADTKEPADDGHFVAEEDEKLVDSGDKESHS